MRHFIGMKLIKIWHFQFSDFEIEKPENFQIVKSLFNWSARIRADYCCHCGGTGQLTAQRMIYPSCLPGSELREVQGECHVIIQPGEGLPRHHCHWSAPGYWHLVTPCHLSPDICLAPGSGHLYVTHWARKCDMSYTQTWHVTLTHSSPLMSFV